MAKQNIAELAEVGADYADVLTLLGCTDTPKNKKTWARGHIRFKLFLLRCQNQLVVKNYQLQIFLGKHYLGQDDDDGTGGDFEVKVRFDGDPAQKKDDHASGLASRAAGSGKE